MKDKSDTDERKLIQAIAGLIDNGLMGHSYGLKWKHHVKQYGDSELPEEGLLVCPNRRGADLFLKALGFSNLDPDVLPNVDCRSRLSQSIRQSLSLPEFARCTWTRIDDPEENIHDEIESRCFEIESEVDDVKNQIDELKSQIKESQEAV